MLKSKNLQPVLVAVLCSIYEFQSLGQLETWLVIFSHVTNQRVNFSRERSTYDFVKLISSQLFCMNNASVVFRLYCALSALFSVFDFQQVVAIFSFTSNATCYNVILNVLFNPEQVSTILLNKSLLCNCSTKCVTPSLSAKSLAF